MRPTPALLLATLLTATAVMPTALGHAAPPPRAFETRIMHDHNDDSITELAGKHGFDAIALDARGVWDPVMQEPALALRLLLNGGCNENHPEECGELSHVVRFDSGENQHRLTFATEDGGTTWTGDMDRYGSPEDINDGTRFAIEGWIRLSALGLAPGATLTDWFVEGYWGEEEADSMPEGSVPGADDPLGAAFVLEQYPVQSPDFYLELTATTDGVQLEDGKSKTIDLTLTNLLPTEQVMSIRTNTSDDLEATIAEAGGAPGKSLEVSMAPNFSTGLELTITGHAGGRAFATVTSDLGGVGSVMVRAEAPEHSEDQRLTTSPNLTQGGSWEHTFDAAGEFSYHNHHAPAQQGTIHVKRHTTENESMDEMESMQRATITYDGTLFDPAELEIQVGDTVVWENQSDATLQIVGSLGGDPHAGHDNHMEHSDHDHEETPGTALVALTLSIVAVATIRRRRD